MLYDCMNPIPLMLILFIRYKIEACFGLGPSLSFPLVEVIIIIIIINIIMVVLYLLCTFREQFEQISVLS